MLLVDASLKNRVAVAVVCLLVLLFAVIAIDRIPIQLTPTVEQPLVTVTTPYPGAAPPEVEQQVTIPIEEQLNAVENLRRLTSNSMENQSLINLEFDWGVNTDLAVADIRDRLDQVEGLPDEVERTLIESGGGSQGSVVFWAVGRETSDLIDINDLREISDNVIVPRLRRVGGVAEVLAFGGREREIHIVLDLEALRARNLTIQQVREAIQRENRNVRGGDLETGRTRYIVRTVGQFETVGEIEDMLITRPGEGEVRLGEVAAVVDDFEDQQFEVRFNGDPAMAFGIVRKTGANTIEVVSGIREAVGELNAFLGQSDITITPAYDETEYIWDSIRMVIINMGIGAILAIAMLMIFLRSPSSTLIIATIIPVALLISIIMLWATGRTINIVSLAGLAFASGMVVDNAIVVLENMYSLQQRGKSREEAARLGAVQVWGAIFASTMTTIAVFAPIVLIREQAGQLFADIALAIAFAVAASLLLALYVIPAAASKILHAPGDPGRFSLHFIGVAFARGYRALLRLILRSVPVRLLILAVLIGSFVGAYLIKPPADYLPQGNQNLFFSFLRMPPGLTLDETNRFLSVIEQRFLNHPARDRMFAVARRGQPIMGFVAKEEASDLETMQQTLGELNGMAQGLPGVFGIVAQASIFERGLQGGKVIEIDLRGPELDRLIQMYLEIAPRLRMMEGVRFVDSEFQLGNPELQVEIDEARATEFGLTVADVANVIETAVGGDDISVFRERGDEYDIVLKAAESILENPDELRAIEVSTPSGRTVPLSSVAQVYETTGPVGIQHIELDRSITINVNVVEDIPLQTVVEQIQAEIVDPLRAAMPAGHRVTLSGSVDDLQRTAVALSSTLVVAVLITYLLLAALFQSFLYPLVIMISLPLAATGGFLGLAIFHETAEFNVITMFGFVILIGIVVNNAILIVSQALFHMREGGLPAIRALEEACMDRLRPIFMSTMTSILGMLPLAVGTGNGSELYRGLGIVVVGGLLLSTLFTLILVPTVFMFFYRVRSLLLREGEGDTARTGSVSAQRG